jgi:cytoskeleton protein RodZ
MKQFPPQVFELPMQRPVSSHAPLLPRAPRVGGDLRAARERLGWSLDDTGRYMRLRPSSLEALEDGRIEDLPGPVYALAFLRSYALTLGLDAEAMVQQYHEEVGAALPPAELRFPTPMPQRHVPAGAVVLLGGLLAVVGYVGWYRVSGERPGTGQVQQVPARLAPLALPVVPPPPARVATAAPVTNSTLAGVYVPPSVPPSAAEAGVPPPGSLAPIEPAPIAVVPGVVPPANRVVLGATADAWVQVKDAQGKVVLSKLLHQGDTWPVPDTASGQGPMVLTTGNAGGTTLTVDGRAAPALGAPGVVKRDVPLDPASLLGGGAEAAAH